LIGNFIHGKLVIGPSGSVTGEVICNNADIEGFNGTIQVAEVLNVKARVLTEKQ
jgi:cytoskeletal protein CcmA (bactofilin family)